MIKSSIIIWNCIISIIFCGFMFRGVPEIVRVYLSKNYHEILGTWYPWCKGCKGLRDFSRNRANAVCKCVRILLYDIVILLSNKAISVSDIVTWHS